MKIHSHRTSTRAIAAIRHGRGMTLIEVLVTLVIISVGLLGVAALQLTTVRNNLDSFVRSQAAVLAGDMLDRIRANRAAALSDANPYAVDFGEPPDPDSVPESDIAQWKETLRAQLPEGDGAIAVDLDTRVVTVTIRWGERSRVAADQQVTFVTNSQI